MHLLGVGLDDRHRSAALTSGGEIVSLVSDGDTSVRGASRWEFLAACLDAASVHPDDIDAVVVHDRPASTFEHIVALHRSRHPFDVHQFCSQTEEFLRDQVPIGYQLVAAWEALGAAHPPLILYGNGPAGMAAAAFVRSPFECAAILVAEGTSLSAPLAIGRGEASSAEVTELVPGPNSLSVLTRLADLWCGAGAEAGERVAVSEAPADSTAYRRALEDVAELREDGSIRIEPAVLRAIQGDHTSLTDLADHLGWAPDDGSPQRSVRRHDLAASIEALIDDAVVTMADRARTCSGEDRICVVGSAAVRAAARKRLGSADRVWAEPLATAPARALGAALTGPRLIARPSAISPVPATCAPRGRGIEAPQRNGGPDPTTPAGWRTSTELAAVTVALTGPYLRVTPSTSGLALMLGIGAIGSLATGLTRPAAWRLRFALIGLAGLAVLPAQGRLITLWLCIGLLSGDLVLRRRTLLRGPSLPDGARAPALVLLGLAAAVGAWTTGPLPLVIAATSLLMVVMSKLNGTIHRLVEPLGSKLELGLIRAARFAVVAVAALTRHIVPNAGAGLAPRALHRLTIRRAGFVRHRPESKGDLHRAWILQPAYVWAIACAWIWVIQVAALLFIFE